MKVNETVALTGGHGRTGFLQARNVFQLARLGAGTLDSTTGIATLTQRTSLFVQLEIVRAQHAAQ